MPPTRPRRRGLPLILVRGFGGANISDERRLTYQGFNDGTVYPKKRGENYIYEGLVLRLLKSDWKFEDATNVVGYYQEDAKHDPAIPDELKDLPKTFFSNHRVIVDPAMALHIRKETVDLYNTVWVLRYYDLGERNFRDYALALQRLIEFIRAIATVGADPAPKVNIIAHSMGGLIVREAVQNLYDGKAADHINKIVTLGTPHRGISFQILGSWMPSVGPGDELNQFNPEQQEKTNNPSSYKNFGKHFPLDRLLTVVGTNYRTYGVRPASMLNRLFSVGEEFGLNYNRSDGLVKQTNAQIPGAPRTFVHKCHGGSDSLVTSREAFEIATRFFFGNVRVRLRYVRGRVKRGHDVFGKSEFFFGVSIKPRGVDFDLFHQSPEAENCYGPFRSPTLSDDDVAFPWADDDKLIWEGWLDTSCILDDPSRGVRDIVMRLDVFVGERDLFGVGFSDNVVFRKQYYLQATLPPNQKLYCHTGEEFAGPGGELNPDAELEKKDGGWEFEVRGTGFEGTLRVEIEGDENEEAFEPED